MLTLEHPGEGALHGRFTARQVGEVYQFMYRHLGNREEAERLTAQTFLEAQTTIRLARVAGSASIERLLYATALDALSAELRDRYRGAPESAARVEALVRGNNPGGASRSDGSAQVYAQSALARLPAPERDLLSARLLRDTSLERVAEAMGLSLNGALALQWGALAHAAQIVASDQCAASTPQECDA